MLSRRFLSTAVPGSKAQLTQLSNGLIVATKPSGSATSSIGAYIGAGSRGENPYNSGVSTLLGNILAKSQESSATSAGVAISSHNSKEVSAITTEFAKGNSAAALSVLEGALSKATLDKSLSSADFVKSEASKAAAFANKFESSPKDMVLEHLTATAFQGTSLALPTFGKADTLESLESMDLEQFHKTHFTNSNAVIVGTGDVDHQKLVAFAQKLSLVEGVKPIPKASKYLGSEVRMRDDTMSHAYIALAAKGESLGSEDYYVAKVASQINGNYLAASPFSKFLGSKLSHIVTENHLAESYSHFSNSYSDNGLWGFYAETSNLANIDDLMHFTLKDWNRLSTSISETEVERAKQQLKVSLLGDLSSVDEANKLGSDALLQGYQPSAEDIVSKIEQVSVKSVKAWAQHNLYDQDIVVSATGRIEGLFDYARLRNDMSMMRW